MVYNYMVLSVGETNVTQVTLQLAKNFSFAHDDQICLHVIALNYEQGLISGYMMLNPWLREGEREKEKKRSRFVKWQVIKKNKAPTLTEDNWIKCAGRGRISSRSPPYHCKSLSLLL